MNKTTVRHYLKEMASDIVSAENTLNNLKSNLSVLLGYFNESDLNTIVQHATYNQGKIIGGKNEQNTR